MNDILTAESDLDEAKLDATTEEDIQRYKAEDGYASFPDPSTPCRIVLPPAAIRERLQMTQDAFARALRIPVATLRDWEEGRDLPDPAARSLLDAVARDPKAVLAALNPGSAFETIDEKALTESA